MINKIFNNQNLSKIFFYIFIFLLPWQTRLILFPQKIEYLGFSIYLSEIFLWLALGFWLLESYKKIRFNKIFLFFYIFTFISLMWADNKISGFRLVLYMFEGMLIYEYIKNNKKIITSSIYIFLSSLFFAFLLGLSQFINLGSVEFKWLGLASRGAWNLGDIVLDDGVGRWLRIYGSLPHPNIFGGYLAVAILFIGYLIKKENKNNFRYFFNYFLAGVFTFGLLLTFSRSAWLAFIVAFLYFIFKNLSNKNVRKFFFFIIILSSLLVYIFYPLIKSRTTSSLIENRSISERQIFTKEALVLWKNNPLLGVGIGNYIVALEKQYLYKFEYQYQPVHNIFLLILTELGIFGFLLFLLLLRRVYKESHYKPLLILFIIVGLFDHYLWTLYPGVLLFWVSLSLSE